MVWLVGVVWACVFRVGVHRRGRAGSAELGQAAEVVEDGLVGAGPGPSGGEAEQEAASVVDNAAGDAVEADSDGASGGEHPGGLDAAWGVWSIGSGCRRARRRRARLRWR